MKKISRVANQLRKYMMEILIRKARKSDLLAIQRLLSVYFLDLEELGPEDFVLAEVEGKIAGCAALIKSESQGKSFLEIHSIAVHPNLRGKRIGTRLIKYLLSTADDRAYDLYVRTNAPGFFEKMNFIKIKNSEKLLLWGDCKNCEYFSKCTQHLMKYNYDC